MSTDLLLVIPAFEEAERLPRFLTELAESLAAGGLGSRVTVTVVDDGSSPDQAEGMAACVREVAARHPFVTPILRRDANLGKGGTVYAGWDTAAPATTWLGFVDADGAVAAGEVVRLAREVVESSVEDGALYAVRYPAPADFVERRPLRGVLGRVFALLVRILFGFPLRDTQCGLKFVPAEVFRSFRGALTEFRFCFDVELTHHLLRCGVPIRARPIRWQESPGSKVRLSSAARMFLSLLALRRRLH